jgi:DNA-binding protein
MSEQLSFTQALRENGFTQSNENSQNNNDEDAIEKTEKVVEVSNDNTVNNNYNDDEVRVMYIGNKSVMNYVFTLVNIFNEESDVVSIQARGRVINKAVDVVEVLRHRFITDLTIEDISISTQQIIRDDGRESNVSAINITIRN